MMYKIEIFLLVISLIYSIKFQLEFVIKLFEKNPEPIKVTILEKIFLLLSISYIITFLITN